MEEKRSNIIMCYYNVLGVRENKKYWKDFEEAIDYLHSNGIEWSESEGRYTYR